jgi:hypothetical protein
MSLRTWFLFLLGNRQAILDLASDRGALAVGAVFVLSAGLAREYDGKDLVHEPWHLLIPYAASLGTSFLLFTLLFIVGRTKGWEGPGFWSAYLSFLTLFWMTAPLAWLYGIPYERFLTPLGATQANLVTLGLVAAWRVGLIIRVVSVWMGAGLGATISLVLLFADLEALFALYVTPLPVIQVMGGVRYSPSEALLLRTAVWVGILGIVTLAVWFVGATLTGSRFTRPWHPPNLTSAPATRLSHGLAYLAGASLAFWAAMLPFTQREQLLRWRVEKDFKEDRIPSALAEMSAHAPEDFPPQWQPPPKLAYREATPSLLDILEEMVRHPPAPWVHTLYVERLDQYLGALLNNFPWDPQRGEVLEQSLARATDLLYQLPEGPALVAEHRQGIERLIKSWEFNDSSLRLKLKTILDAQPRITEDER